MSLLLLFQGVGGALLGAQTRISFSSTVAPPVTGAALAASTTVSFVGVNAGLIVPEAFHVHYGAQVNKTCGILIHAE